MVRILRIPDNNFIAVIATDVKGKEHNIQYKSDSPFSTLPGPNSNPHIQKIIDLTGGFNLWGDGARCIVKSYHLGFSSSSSHSSSTRLMDTASDLVKAFGEAGFPEPVVVPTLPVRLMRAVGGWLGLGRVAL